MRYEIYYNRKDSPFSFGIQGRPQNLNDIKTWYVKVYTKNMRGKIVENNLERIFSGFNLSTNPLGTKKMQQWIREHDVAHTSMSVGEIVKVDGEWWYCADVGWEKMELIE